jgi:hypothetical protein
MTNFDQINHEMEKTNKNFEELWKKQIRTFDRRYGESGFKGGARGHQVCVTYA